MDILPDIYKVKSRRVCTVVICSDHDSPTKIDSVSVCICTRSGDEHSSGTIIVWKNKRSLDGPGSDNHLFRTNAPESLPQPGLLRVSFDNRQHIVIVVACNRAVRESANIGQTIHLSGNTLNPLERGATINLSRFTKQSSPRPNLIVHNHHLRSAFTRD